MDYPPELSDLFDTSFFQERSYSLTKRLFLDDYFDPDQLEMAARLETSPSNLKRLSPEAENVHNEVYRTVVRELDRPFKRRSVYSYTDCLGNGGSMIDFPGIVLSPEVANLNSGNSEYSIYAASKLGPRSPADFLKAVLAHEYGHQVFDAFYKRNILHALPARDLSSDLSLAVSEAFAFWFSEELTGDRHLTENLARLYDSKFDVRTMKYVYTCLKNASTKHDTKYVLDYLVDLVADDIAAGVEDVTLPSSSYSDAIRGSSLTLSPALRPSLRTPTYLSNRLFRIKENSISLDTGSFAQYNLILSKPENKIRI